jgi:hypothetical protein
MITGEAEAERGKEERESRRGGCGICRFHAIGRR